MATFLFMLTINMLTTFITTQSSTVICASNQTIYQFGGNEGNAQWIQYETVKEVIAISCNTFNTSCADDEYQCSDTGSCITKSWLCDGISDCMNGEDETQFVCNANGVYPNSNSCIQSGYFYQCAQCSSCCLYSYQMCDGNSDCPGGDVEVTDNCDDAWAAATSTTTQFTAGGSGSLSCGESYSGTTSYDYFSYSFVGPSDAEVLIHSCDTENEGEVYFDITDGISTYIYSDIDFSCACSNRGIIHTTGLSSGTTYTVGVGTSFSGNYKFTVLCGSGLSSPGTCTESASSFTTSSAYYYWP